MKESIFVKLGVYLTHLIRVCCPPLHIAIFSEYHEKRLLKVFLGFIAGFALGQAYYNLFLKDIKFPFLSDIGFILSIIISIVLGVANSVSTQVRCISLLLFPMYCGKAGRGVLKAIVLTYVVAGPITNMGLNAKEVVRVFACTTQLTYNLSKIMYAQTYRPLNKALLDFTDDVIQIKETIRSIRDVISPIDYEIAGLTNLQQMKDENDFTDGLFDIAHRTNLKVLKLNQSNEKINFYHELYTKKMQIRCENQLSHAISLCIDIFSSAYDTCSRDLPSYIQVICWPLMLPRVCDVKRIVGSDVCDFKKQIDSSLGEGYTFLKSTKEELTSNLDMINLQHKIYYERNLYDIQDAKETGERLLHAFAEKYTIMKFVIITINIFLAFLFLRIPIASVNYHDLYLKRIDYDNVYITDYFNRIDERRRKKNKFTLLPLKKMERYRYIDVHSASFIPSERNKLLTQILKLMLEAVTATTFVMLDRLFYEALDVVKQHALEKNATFPTQDIAITVEGKGPLSSMLRKVLREFNFTKSNQMFSNVACIPKPRAMPIIYYFKIYGGYLWILLLLYTNPYTLRLRSYFYCKREKQRILHLYNDILKKRMRMQKTLRKKAVQAVRAHYLSGENLLSMRMRYPQWLGWLGTLPLARMKCLICEETEPRYANLNEPSNSLQVWHSCISTRCPFVYCNECWLEVGLQCLACDPALGELSDVDSLSDDNPPRY